MNRCYCDICNRIITKNHNDFAYSLKIELFCSYELNKEICRDCVIKIQNYVYSLEVKA